MVSVQQSRFSLLKIDDDIDDAKSPNKDTSSNHIQGQQNNSKKKNKKKKKLPDETQELRSIAFGGGSLKAKPKPRAKSAAENANKTSKPADWDKWVKQDKELTAETYEKDLQQALLESKLVFEEKCQARKDLEAQGITLDGNGKQKKKKKSARPPPMTLDEFKAMRLEEAKAAKDSSDEEEEPKMAPLEPTTEIFNPDSKYFAGVSDEVLKILRKEKIQESYQKQYAVENVRERKFKEEIDKRDKELVQLRLENQAVKDELKQVKKRNQQLCHILSQGEMKDKTKILLELDELKQVRDELTQEVAELHTQLQKERSKPKQAESSKSKGGKK